MVVLGRDPRSGLTSVQKGHPFGKKRLKGTSVLGYLRYAKKDGACGVDDFDNGYCDVSIRTEQFALAPVANALGMVGASEELGLSKRPSTTISARFSAMHSRS